MSAETPEPATSSDPVLADVAPVDLWDDDYWFARRNSGPGWAPVTWQGWLVVMGFVFGMIAVVFAGLIINVAGLAPDFISIPLMIIGPVALLAALFVIMRRRTDRTRTRADYLMRKAGMP